MNNDRELLEQAAKAAGYDYECTAHTGYPEHDQHQIRSEFGTLVDWNPLTDDGHALRLAVKLGIDISFGIFASQINAEIYDWVEEEVKAEVHEGGRDDPYAATRRAIVRAAAEIGKDMK